MFILKIRKGQTNTDIATLDESLKPVMGLVSQKRRLSGEWYYEPDEKGEYEVRIFSESSLSESMVVGMIEHCGYKVVSRKEMKMEEMKTEENALRQNRKKVELKGEKGVAIAGTSASLETWVQVVDFIFGKKQPRPEKFIEGGGRQSIRKISMDRWEEKISSNVPWEGTWPKFDPIYLGSREIIQGFLDWSHMRGELEYTHAICIVEKDEVGERKSWIIAWFPSFGGIIEDEFFTDDGTLIFIAPGPLGSDYFYGKVASFFRDS